MTLRPSPSNWGLVLLFLLIVPLMMCSRNADARGDATFSTGTSTGTQSPVQ